MCLAWHVGEAKEMQKDLVPKKNYVKFCHNFIWKYMKVINS